jgi:predicted porin
MNGLSRRVRLYAGVSLSALILAAGANDPARAQSVSDATVKALLSRIEQLEREVKDLKQGQVQSNANAKAALKEANQAKAQAATQPQARVIKGVEAEEIDEHGHRYFQHKRGAPLTFYTPGGEITGYGNFDVSLDYASKNVGHLNLNGSSPPVGKFGWLPDISTNLSYLGVRGYQRLGELPFNFVYQFEAGIEISANPGNRGQSTDALSNQVNGAIFSRNTYIGLASPDWGAIKIGKTDAPYKNSTAMFNPFSGMWGDYQVIMGNTGGDNRVEFGTRAAHAIWYESPVINGWSFSVLASPGQNRSSTNDNVPLGEPDCTGGNDPTSTAGIPVACGDGSFGNLYSASLTYKNGPLLVVGAAEFHEKVNRSGDISGIFGIANPQLAQPAGTAVFLGPTGQALFNADVANEWAAKIGVLYTFPTRTTIGGIFEWMRREVPASLAFQNERSRNGTWLFVSQELTSVDSIHFGWAHAFKTVGDPGQHNSATLAGPADTCSDINGAPVPCTAAFAPNNNRADMITAAYKHNFTPNLQWYVDAAATFNGPSAHFDLGAGGRAVVTDCHDANSTSGGAFANPHCFTGTTIVGVSTGIKWTF